MMNNILALDVEQAYRLHTRMCACADLCDVVHATLAAKMDHITVCVHRTTRSTEVIETDMINAKTIHYQFGLIWFRMECSAPVKVHAIFDILLNNARPIRVLDSRGILPLSARRRTAMLSLSPSLALFISCFFSRGFFARKWIIVWKRPTIPLLQKRPPRDALLFEGNYETIYAE